MFNFLNVYKCPVCSKRFKFRYAKNLDGAFMKYPALAEEQLFCPHCEAHLRENKKTKNRLKLIIVMCVPIVLFMVYELPKEYGLIEAAYILFVFLFYFYHRTHILYEEDKYEKP